MKHHLNEKKSIKNQNKGKDQISCEVNGYENVYLFSLIIYPQNMI